MKSVSMNVMAVALMLSSSMLQAAITGTNPASPASDGSPGLFGIAGSTTFVQTDFEYTLSSGVSAAALQTNTNIVVTACHTKGRFTYGGNSEGGSVKACEASASAAGFSAIVAPTDATDECAAVCTPAT